MKLLVGNHAGITSVYGVRADGAVDLGAGLASVGTDLRGLIGSDALRTQAREMIADMAIPTVRLDRITPMLPVENPGKILCLGLNYIDHIKEGGYEVPDYPAMFIRTRQSVMAAGQPLIRPLCSDHLDYEAELMIVVGKGGRHIDENSALDHVFGYTVFNDGSIRDYQNKTHQWMPGKNFDNTGAIGPYVVTPDDLPNGASGLKIESRVGAEILQSSNTANMIWNAARIISIMSEFTTLEPGDLIATGTPPGVGHAKKPTPRWLVPGETIEIEIEGIGICASPVQQETGN
ncbi:fumarylacetoacetate hydrolase family protein [Falsirhodobacter sp. alg1]|uniref:fumarylacetoacetate hydrolase family protein n=1 Tax=Falsirhodobacter sp. alg1 TaxID=1472418 RepID=UPI0005EF5F9F|nr:fumarylacetoacetate hydrolase family protein [Falsirhodobacter sp. alg1]